MRKRDQLAELLRRAYELRRTAPGSTEEGRVLAEIARDPRIVFRYENARKRYSVDRSSCCPDSVLILTISESEFQGVAAFLNLLERCALGYMRDQARAVAGVRRLRKPEQSLLNLIRSDFPRAGYYKNLATFLFNHRAVLMARARSSLGLSDRQIIGAIEGLAAKHGLTRVDLDDAAAPAKKDDLLDALYAVTPAALVSGLVRHKVIPPPPREHVEPLLEIRFTRDAPGGSTAVSELAAKRLGGKADKWTQVFHRFKTKLGGFLAGRYPGLEYRDAFKRFIEEEIK